MSWSAGNRVKYYARDPDGDVFGTVTRANGDVRESALVMVRWDIGPGYATLTLAKKLRLS